MGRMLRLVSITTLGLPLTTLEKTHQLFAVRYTLKPN